MVPLSTPSSVPNTSCANFLSPRMNNLRKPSSNRHLKVDGKDRRIRLSMESAELVFELKKRLDHRTAGETVEWLLIQAKPSIDAVFNKNPTFPPPAPRVTYPCLSPPMSFPPDGIIFPSDTKFQSIPIYDGDKMSSSLSRSPKPILPSSKYGSETDVEISADAVAKFLSDSSS